MGAAEVRSLSGHRGEEGSEKEGKEMSPPGALREGQACEDTPMLLLLDPLDSYLESRGDAKSLVVFVQLRRWTASESELSDEGHITSSFCRERATDLLTIAGHVR